MVKKIIFTVFVIFLLTRPVLADNDVIVINEKVFNIKIETDINKVTNEKNTITQWIFPNDQFIFVGAHNNLAGKYFYNLRIDDTIKYKDVVYKITKIYVYKENKITLDRLNSDLLVLVTCWPKNGYKGHLIIESIKQR